MAMDNFDSKSSQKRSWEESESCPTIETVPKASSNGEDEINTNKKLCVSTESGAVDGPIQSSSKTSLQVDGQTARTSSTEGYDSGVNGLKADDGRETDGAERLRDSGGEGGEDLQEPGSSAENQDGGDGSDGEADSCSEISDLSGMSSEGWRPVSGAMVWVHRQMEAGVNPREILNRLLPRRTVIPDDIDDFMLWRAVIEIVTEPPRRKKLPDVNTMDDVIRLLRTSERIMVLTGAGVSVSCGIPDFRSKDGIYSRLAVEYPDLPDPQAMFDISYFKRNQGPFFKFAKEIYPGQFEPSIAHKFVRLIETHRKLLRNYTQNIDTLEQVAHIDRVIQCHGSFATATCMVCKYKTDADGVKEDIMNQIVPRCPHCPSDESLAIMKPDIVFFGESLPEEFHRQMELDKDECDMLIVMGSSLKVRPVALIPNSLPAHVPQVLINREPLKHMTFDVELLGNCDIIVNELCRRLGDGWNQICTNDVSETSNEITRDEMVTPVPPSGDDSPYHAPPGGGGGGDAVTKTQDDTMTSSSTNGSQSTQSPEVTSSSTAGSSSTAESHGSSCSNDNANTHTSVSTTDTKDSSSVAGNNTERMESNAQTEAKNENAENVVLESDLTTNSAAKASTSGNESSNCTQESSGQSDAESKPSASEVDGKGHGASSDCDEAKVRDAHERDDAELAMLRASWQPKLINLASRLPEDSHLFLPPNRYVFQGAEVYDDIDDEDDSDLESSDSDPESPDNSSLSSRADAPTPPTPAADNPEEASTHAPTTTAASSSSNGQTGLIPLGKETQAEVDAGVKALAEDGNDPVEQELKPSTKSNTDSVNQSATATEATPSGDNMQR